MLELEICRAGASKQWLTAHHHGKLRTVVYVTIGDVVAHWYLSI